jgi:predicted branched-subunit amino acid permease
MKAAIPVWIAFVPSSLAWGIAAHGHGLTFMEVVLLSAWVYSGPAQFAVLGPLAQNQSAAQVLIAGSLMNVRFLPMSAALAPFFRGVKRPLLVLSSQVISASSFIVPYLRFERETGGAGRDATAARTPDGYENLAFFLGVGATAFSVWVIGSASGFALALGVPRGFEEGLRFILPGYFAGLLAVEMKDRMMALVCVISFLAAVAGALLDPAWGWIITAMIIAPAAWMLDQWKSRASKSS